MTPTISPTQPRSSVPRVRGKRNHQRQDDVWWFRQFQKDRLRVRERHWEPLSDAWARTKEQLGLVDNDIVATTTPKKNQGASKHHDHNVLLVIPDGLVWRKYLRLISHLVQHNKNDDARAKGSTAQTQSIKFILLESAAELMDWRNSSPCITVNGTIPYNNNNNHGSHGVADEMVGKGSLPPQDYSENKDTSKNLTKTSTPTYMQEEAAGAQERSRIQKLVMSSSSSVIPFCDLTVREDKDDEWDLFDYANMAIVDRSKLALFRAARLLNTSPERNSSFRLEIIVLVDESDTSKFGHVQHLQSETSVRVLTVDDFLEWLHHQPLEMISTDEFSNFRELRMDCESDYRRRNAPPSPITKSTTCTLTERTLSEEDIRYGLAQGTLFRGRLDVTKENPTEAFVNVPDHGRYFIQKEHYGRALHFDVVVIQPLQESEWGHPVGRRRLVHHRLDHDDDDDGKKNKVFRDSSSTDTAPVPSANVVTTIIPSRRIYVATMTDQPLPGETHILVVPMDIRIPKIRLNTRSWINIWQKRVLVQVDDWEEGSNYPKGRVIQILGSIGDLEVEIASLLHENEVDLEPFSLAALACLPAAGAAWTIPIDEIQKRRDLRECRRIFSVDPLGCQDIDDTMHAQVLPNGDIEFGVHIADVTYFVKHNSPLDKQAQARATTFYLVDRRFDMLPSLLSSVDRLAVSVIWVMSPNFDTVKSCWYGRTVIRNCQAMTYDQAHNIIHDKAPDDPTLPPPPPLTAGAPVDPHQIPSLKHDLLLLTQLARKLRKDREVIGGAVDLSSGDLGRELKFALDENGNPVKVSSKHELEIHHTIAEMMILANSYVADKIYESLPDSALLRVHSAVDENRFEDLEEALDAGGIAFDGSSNMALARSLKQAEQQGKSGAIVNSFFRSLATRAMSEAQYVCTGTERQLSHYGLGLGRYTHFTSPIRRYADVVVHKQLLFALQNESMEPVPHMNQPQSAVRTNRLQILPESNVISILAGEGLVRERDQGENVDQENSNMELEGDELLDSLIQGAADLALGSTMAKEELHRDSTEESSFLKDLPERPYEGDEIAKICNVLNRHNRLAKLSSMECQRLFLSIYFRDHYEITEAVVTSLRVNGFWVYVPKFDLKGPLYVSDMDGNVQIDPMLLGLAPDAGLPPTVGFAGSWSTARKFPHGKTALMESSEGTMDRLEVIVDDARHIGSVSNQKVLTVRMLDVVTVQVFCDSWDVRARVPSPRLHLLSTRPRSQQATTPKQQHPGQSVGSQQSRHQTKITSKLLATSSSSSSSSVPQRAVSTRSVAPIASLYQEIASIPVTPVLMHIPDRSYPIMAVSTTTTTTSSNLCSTNNSRSSGSEVAVESIIPGRMVFGGFINPDTKSATQHAAAYGAALAATQRRQQQLNSTTATTTTSRLTPDSTQSLERSATARIQRLGAEKRNTRKHKAKS